VASAMVGTAQAAPITSGRRGSAEYSDAADGRIVILGPPFDDRAYPQVAIPLRSLHTVRVRDARPETLSAGPPGGGEGPVKEWGRSPQERQTTSPRGWTGIAHAISGIREITVRC
jgi:hypothetical protein